VGVTEAVAGASLLVFVADLTGYAKRGRGTPGSRNIGTAVSGENDLG
jgi:hypothetical protein